MKDEKYRKADASEARGVIPAEFFAEVGNRKDGEDGEGDDFLDGLELGGVEFIGTDAIRRHLKTVFEESDAPTSEDNFPERFAAVFQVAVPGKRHEDVGNSQKKDRSHGADAPEVKAKMIPFSALFQLKETAERFV